MLVGIHVDYQGGLKLSSRRFEQILTFNKIPNCRVDSSESGFWAKIETLALFIYHWEHVDVARFQALSVIPVVEQHYRIPVFPNLATCWHFDDKIRQYYLMQRYGYPIIPSFVFWDKVKALAWAQEASLPVVFKLRNGAGSVNVQLIRERQAVIRRVCQMFGKGIQPDWIPGSGALRRGVWHRMLRSLLALRYRLAGVEVPYRLQGANWFPHRNYVLFQEYWPENEFDTRITVIGRRAFGFRRLNRPGDFRSSGSGLIEYDPQQIDLKMVEAALGISAAMGFQAMAYDFLYGPEGKIGFCEMSYGFVDTAIFRCPGYWDQALCWHDGHFWPQYLELVDLLKDPDLRQPDIILQCT